MIYQSSDLAPVPSTVLKKISNAISPTILSMVNLHNHRYLPFHLKIVSNQPTVKKPSLNKENLSNYRPIANLSFISKLTEKIVKKRLLDHLTSNSLLNPFQSAFIKFYSTETTLLSLHDHLSNAISMQQVVCLCLLELSAAFDTLTTPSYFIVFPPGLAFPLLHYNGSLHISHPHIYCRIPPHSSPSSPLTCGVPQGSVLA